MSSFILDTFTGTSGTTLDAHTPDLGGPATKITGLSGSAQLTSANRVRNSNGSAITSYQYAATPPAADYDVICDVYIASLSSDSVAAGPVGRAQVGSQAFYWARLVLDEVRTGGAFNGFDLYKVIGGTNTLLTQSSSWAFTAGSTVQMKLSFRGPVLTLYASTDGGATFATVYSITDSSITAAGTAGVSFFNLNAPSDTTGAHVDNLSATAGVTIAPNHSAWFSSSGNWILSSASAISADFGAKRAIVVSGTSFASLSFDLSAIVAASLAAGDYPQIRCSIDNGPVTDLAVAANVNLFTGLGTGSHEIVYEFVRGNFNTDIYTTPVMALRETGMTVGFGASVSAPADLRSERMFVAGDSITAGFAMLSLVNSVGGDATATFAKTLGPALGAEAGIGGKGGVGWAIAGGANVPVFTTAWKNAWNGQPRSFGVLKRFVAVMGTNDGLNSIADSTVTAAVTSWLADARATLGAATWIHLVIPFGGFKRAAITAAFNTYIAAHAGDLCALIDLGTLNQAGLSGPSGTLTRQAPFDGIHPNTIAHGQLGAALAAGIKAAESPLTVARATNNVGGGILAGL
jgi:lysophospholipase L1-like esterase